MVRSSHLRSKYYFCREIFVIKFIKKIYHPRKNFFFGYSINMSNLQQNNIQNEIEQIKKQIDLLQDRLKKNEKSQKCKSKEYE